MLEKNNNNKRKISNKQKFQGDIMSGIEPDNGSWKKWTTVRVQDSFTATAQLSLCIFKEKPKNNKIIIIK